MGALIGLLGWRGIAAAGAVIAVLVVVMMIYGAGHEAGHRDAVVEIERKDARAVRAADEARTDVEGCYERGGTWDAARDRCRDPE